MYETPQHNHPLRTIIILTITFLCVALFSAITVGLFSKSSLDIVKDVSASELKNATHIAMFNEDFLAKADGDTSFKDRLPGKEDKIACSVSGGVFERLANLPGVDASEFENDNGETVDYLVVTKKAVPARVIAVIDIGDQTDCVNVKTGRSFMLTAPFSIS